MDLTAQNYVPEGRENTVILGLVPQNSHAT